MDFTERGGRGIWRSPAKPEGHLVSQLSSQTDSPSGESQTTPSPEGGRRPLRRFLADNRHSAATLLGLILVAFVTAAGFGLHEWRSAEESDSETRVFERAAITADQLESFLTGASPALGAGIERAIDQGTSLQAALAIDGDAWALDRRGRVVGSTGGDRLGFPLEARTAVFGGAFSISGLIGGNGENGPKSVRVGIPLAGSGQVAAVVATLPADVLAGFVDSAMGEIPLTSSSVAAVVGDDGAPLVSTGLEREQGSLLARASQTNPSGSLEIGGATQLYSTAPIGSSPWTVVLTAPQEEVLAAAGGPAGWIGWAVLGEFALCALLGILLLLRVLRDADEVDRANAELSERSAVAEHATEAKNGFISTMAHEMRTPLAAVAMFAEMMRSDEREPLSPAQRRRATDIATSTRHVLDLLDDTTDISRVESGRLELRPERSSVAAIAIGVVDGMHPLALDRGIELSLEADGKLGEVFLDPARMRQVMINFLSNALKFTPNGGSVKMRVGRHGDASFLIAVDDTGIGIAPTEISDVFSAPHVAASPQHSQDGTSGLGLVVTRRLVEAMGGEVAVESQEGHGSTFTAVLPRVGADRLPGMGGSRFQRTAEPVA